MYYRMTGVGGVVWEVGVYSIVIRNAELNQMECNEEG